MELRRTVLRWYDTGAPVTDEELDRLISQLGRAYRRAKAVRDWAECRTHLADTKVDTLVEELKTLVDRVHARVGSGGIYLTD
jgi:hypothetical protein